MNPHKVVTGGSGANGLRRVQQFWILQINQSQRNNQSHQINSTQKDLIDLKVLFEHYGTVSLCKYSQTHKDSSKSFPVVYKVDLQLWFKYFLTLYLNNGFPSDALCKLMNDLSIKTTI